MYYVVGVFIIVIASFAISVVVLLLERCSFSMGKTKRQQLKKQQELQQQKQAHLEPKRTERSQDIEVQTF